MWRSSTVAIILSVVFTVLVVDVRDRVRAAETEKLRAGERAFSRFYAERQRDQLVAIAALHDALGAVPLDSRGVHDVPS